MIEAGFLKGNEACIHSGPLDLDLPDWSGMDDLSTRLTPDEAFALCEEYPKWLPEIAQRTLDRYPKCVVEFVL